MLCLMLLALFAFIVIRALRHALRNEDPFTRFAAAGLAILFGAAVGHQHGGQPASDAGQGHDAAVHLLWRLVDDLARLRHGHAARADARAAARRDAGAARHAALPGVRPDGGRRAPSFSPPAAPAAICFPPRRWPRRWPSAASPSILRPIARAARYGRRFPPRRASMSSRARPSAARNPISLAQTGERARLRRAARPGCMLPRLQAGGRWSASAAIRPCRRCSPRALRGIPTLIHEQNAVMGRANRLLAPRVTRHRDRLSRHSRSRSGAGRQGDAHRQSGAAGGDRGGGDALSAARRRRAAAAARVRRQPGRARHGRHRAARDRAARAALADAADDRAAGARGGPAARARRLCEAAGRRRGRAVLHRSAGAHGGEPSGGVALRRLDRRRACRDRPARHPGAAAARARPGPARQCRRAGGCGRRDPPRSGRIHARAARGRDRGAGRRRPAASPRMAAAAKAAGVDRRRRPARRSGAAGGGCDTALRG